MNPLVTGLVLCRLPVIRLQLQDLISLFMWSYKYGTLT